jgi:hypothetical protein
MPLRTLGFSTVLLRSLLHTKALVSGCCGLAFGLVPVKRVEG